MSAARDLSRRGHAPRRAAGPLVSKQVLRQQLSEILALVDDAPEGDVADGLTRWLDEVERRAALRLGHRDRLSPRTVEAYRYSAALLAVELGGVELAQLDESLVLKALDSVSRGSWHCVGTSWQAALSWLGLAEVMPDRRHWANRPEPLTWDPEDYDRAFGALALAYDRATVLKRGGSISVSLCAVLVAVLGLRVGEVVGLRRSDVRRGWITVTGKTGERRVPLTTAAREIVELCPGKEPRSFLFPSRKGSKHPHIRESSVSHHVRRVCDDAGLPHVHTHWLRHAYASWLASKGYSLTVISRLLGHTSVATTARYYLHVADKEQEVAAEAVGQALTRGQLALFGGAR
ncbi:MAG: site-specific integrase [Deltaproteobacteria bacterium]|nr:site-specific integrase [Deltaproteobacteria bacterium]